MRFVLLFGSNFRIIVDEFFEDAFTVVPVCYGALVAVVIFFFAVYAIAASIICCGLGVECPVGQVNTVEFIGHGAFAAAVGREPAAVDPLFEAGVGLLFGNFEGTNTIGSHGVLIGFFHDLR